MMIQQLLLLLEDQYDVVEEYANAQAFLWNATTVTRSMNMNNSTMMGGKSDPFTSSFSSTSEFQSESDVTKAIKRLGKARDNVRSNLKELQEHIHQNDDAAANFDAGTRPSTNDNSNNNNGADNNRNIVSKQQQKRFTDHLGLSRRVIRTIANNPLWYSNGLPAPAPAINSGNNNNSKNNNSSTLQTNTVAIAVLKASIANIREIEE